MRATGMWMARLVVVMLAWPTSRILLQGENRLTALSASSASATKPLEGPYWKAIELAGKPTPAQDPQHEAHLQFEAGGRVSGSDGCNRLTGTYHRSGDCLTFGQMAGTQMACLNTIDTEEAFRNALKNVARFTINEDRLEFFDASGTRLAVFSATTQPASRPSQIERLRARADSGSTIMPLASGKVPDRVPRLD
jgi:heat shock protein HslJ